MDYRKEPVHRWAYDRILVESIIRSFIYVLDHYIIIVSISIIIPLKKLLVK
jgi:hypothetical protein